ncbi:MAG TPA: DUF541 domain-containing protein, partial [Aliiroseovarius sp.]|nr:DUF541 domain-containing protein [Aliiroseovarius sp.]
MRFLSLIIGFVLVLPVSLAAEEGSRTITVTGQGRVEAEPDMATITLGVTQQANDAAKALQAVQTVSARIYTSLSGIGIEARDMQTSNLNLHPFYSNRTSSNSQPPRIVGFSASNMVTIRVRDLTKVGPVLNMIARDGGNEFNGLRFGLQVPAPLREQARVAAVKDAIARAGVLAEAAGVTLGPVQTISENGGGGAPVMMMRNAEFASDAMPVAAGELSITA